MAKAYPQYYRKPSALKSMPSMIKGLCQGCGTRQVNQGIKVSFGPREKVKRFCAVSTFFSPWNICAAHLFYFFKFIFNWRIIVLQYCVGFCHTSVWISHRPTHVSFLLNLPATFHPILIPLGCHKAPDLSYLHYVANSHWLSILCMVIYVAILLSICPPSPTVSTNLSSMSASLLLLCRWIHQYHLSRFHIYALICNICFSLSDFILYNRL